MVLRRIIIVRGGAQDIGVSAFQEIAPHDALARVSEFWRGRFGEGKLAACAGKIALEKKRFAKTNGQSYVFRIQFYPAALQLDRPIVISARKEKRRCGLEYLIVGWPAAKFLFETAQSAFGSRAAEIVDVGHGLVIVRISEKEGSKFGGWSGDDGDFVVVTQADGAAFRRMDTIHRAHVHTGGIFGPDTWFSDDVCHGPTPAGRIFPPSSLR